MGGKGFCSVKKDVQLCPALYHRAWVVCAARALGFTAPHAERLRRLADASRRAANSKASKEDGILVIACCFLSLRPGTLPCTFADRPSTGGGPVGVLWMMDLIYRRCPYGSLWWMLLLVWPRWLQAHFKVFLRGIHRSGI